MIKAVTCYRIDIQPGEEVTWTGIFIELPSLSEIQEAVELKLGSGRSSNGTLLDIIDGIRSDDVQRLMEYKLRDSQQFQQILLLKAYTPSRRTCLGEMRISEGVTVFCCTDKR